MKYITNNNNNINNELSSNLIPYNEEWKELG